MDLLETDIEKCPINHLGQNNDHVLNRLTLEQTRPVKTNSRLLEEAQ